MANLKALRDDYQLETETVANSAKTATFEKSVAKLATLAGYLSLKMRQNCSF